MAATTTLSRFAPMKSPVVAAILAALAGGAFAQEAAPTNYIGIKETGGRDSNVYRVPNGPHDYFYSTSLLGSLDKTISRQRLYGTAEVDVNRYHNAKDLNNNSYAINAGWDWQTIEKLSGKITGTATQSLASQYGNASIPTVTRNVAKADQIAASARYGGDSILTLEGNYGHSRVSYSAPEYVNQNSTGDTASLGGFYRLGPTLRIGLGGRFTHVDQPNALANGTGGFTSETTNGRNLDLTADWEYSSQTNVNTRLSYTKQTYSGGSSAGDFSGLTGAIYANYLPTAKLAFSAALIRDAGINPTFFNTVQAPTTNTGPTTSSTGLSENSQVTNSATLGLRYAATAKISANLGYQYRKSTTVYDQTILPPQGPTYDKYQLSSLGLTYNFDRNWQLSCAYTHELRTVIGTGPFAYSDNVRSCSAQFLLR